MINRILKYFGRKIVSLTNRVCSGGWNVFGSFTNSSKETVNNDTALTVSTFYAAVRNISEDVAKMPLKIYKKEGDYRYEQSGHSVFNLLNYRPNPRMSAISFRQTLTAHAIGYSGGYAYIERDVRGNPIALWPLRPDKTSLKSDSNGELYYETIDDNGGLHTFWPENIIHIYGLSGDGMTGYNIVELMSQSIGSAIAMDKFSGSYFGNGLHSGGQIKHPTRLSAEAQERLKKQMEGQIQGADNSFSMLVLEEGMEFVENKVDPKASQMIESRAFSVTEFCRWLRIPPHKVADLTRATFSNIEEQNTDYVTDTLMAWCIRWELEIWAKLFTPIEQQQSFYAKHITEIFLRGDIETRYNAYATALEHGWFSIDEIRAMEDRNPIDGGNKHFVPMNYTTLDNAGKSQTEPFIQDISNRLANAEIRELEKRVSHAKEDPERFSGWLQEFYQKHDKYICEATKPMDGSSIVLDMLSLKPFMLTASDPVAILNDRKERHADYIAHNLRGYYEN